MTVLPPLSSSAVDRILLVLTSLVTVWVLGTGVVLLTDYPDLQVQPQWQDAQFDRHVSLAVYGLIFIAGGLLLVWDLLVSSSWRLRLWGSGVTGVCALFLSISLIVAAAATGLGWLGALSNLFVVTVLTVVVRYTLREHPFGGP